MGLTIPVMKTAGPAWRPSAWRPGAGATATPASGVRPSVGRLCETGRQGGEGIHVPTPARLQGVAAACPAHTVPHAPHSSSRALDLLLLRNGGCGGMGTEVRAIAGVGSSILGPWDTSISRLQRGTARQQARLRRCSRHRRQHGLRTWTFPPHTRLVFDGDCLCRLALAASSARSSSIPPARLGGDEGVVTKLTEAAESRDVARLVVGFSRGADRVSCREPRGGHGKGPDTVKVASTPATGVRSYPQLGVSDTRRRRRRHPRAAGWPVERAADAWWNGRTDGPRTDTCTADVRYACQGVQRSEWGVGWAGAIVQAFRGDPLPFLGSHRSSWLQHETGTSPSMGEAVHTRLQ